MWKNIFAVLTFKKNFVNHIKNLPLHLSEKFIGQNLSIIDIALKKLDLSIAVIAHGFFVIIDHGYCFSTERFIVPITACSTLHFLVLFLTTL